MSRDKTHHARSTPAPSRGNHTPRGMLVPLLLLAAVAGAAGGWLIPRAGQLVGGRCIHWALAAWGIFFIAAYVARCIPRLKRESASVAGVLILGPVVGGLIGYFTWGVSVPWLGQWPWAVLQSLGFAGSSWGGAAAGAIGGLAIAAFYESGDVQFAGATLGLIPGAALGLLGDWGTDTWFVGPATGGLVALVLIRTALVGQSLHLGTPPGHEVAAHAIAGAVLGLFLCGVAPYLIWGIEWIGLWTPIADFLVFFCQAPAALCNRAGFASGWLGGLAGGGLIFTFVLGRWIDPDERGDGIPPLELLAGAILGLIDWLTGGAILAAALENPISGALLGALVCAIAFEVMYREPEDQPLFGSSVILLILGATLWGLCHWNWLAGYLPASALWSWLPAILGGLAGLAIFAMLTDPSLIIPPRELSKGDAKDRTAIRCLGTTFAIALVAFFPWAAKAANALSHLTAGYGHSWLLNDQRAVAEFTRAERLNPHIATIYEERGECWQRLKRYDSAAADFTVLIERYPSNVEYLLSRSEAWQDARQTARSLKDIQSALAIAPLHVDVHIRKAELLSDLKLYEPAALVYEKALALDAGNIQALGGKANSLRMLDRDAEAQSAYEQVLKSDPQSASAHAGLGWLYLSQERVDEAVREFSLAAEASPKSAFAREGLGWARERRGDYRSALEDFQQALALEPDRASAYEGRARCQSAIGNYDAALRDYAAAMQLTPGDPDLFTGRGNVYRKMNDDKLADADQARASALRQQKDNRKSQLAAAWETAARSGDLSSLEQVLAAQEKD